MLKMIGNLNLFKFFHKVPILKVQHKVSSVALGRWATVSSEKEKMRRIDLANLDSCGAEDCADPYLLIQNYKDAYYLGNLQNKSLDRGET